MLVDANLLLYAYDSAAKQHLRAKAWWEERLNEPRPVRLAWSTILAFVRIATHPRVFVDPMTIDEAVSCVDAWLARPMVGVLEPGDGHWEILARLLRNHQAHGNLVADAFLAALAIEHGATLCSADQDFSRFAELDWCDPFAPRE
ncbi:MAG: PIN domain-containing protein [Deltaproteobacteria bacterium]|nr:PIN domain-containing protein [Deltaproteobacteria bacterium]